MEDLAKEQKRLAQKASYKSSIDEIDQLIQQITATRNTISNSPATTPIQLARLNQTVKKSFEGMNNNLKEVNSGVKSYSKVLDRTFKHTFEENEGEPLDSKSNLINRAIAMHLLREGQFNVATTFIRETSETFGNGNRTPGSVSAAEANWESKSESLQKQFGEMYHILDEIRNSHNLSPAIEWAREHSQILDSRGSNLEFELCRLRFVTIFMGMEDADGNMMDSAVFNSSNGNPAERIMRATAYARENFATFHPRYSREIFQLLGAVAYWQNVPASPYRPLFANDSAWDDVAGSFTREFCALLGLSANSPLYIAATAGAIALPVLQKVKNLMRAKRTEWTTEEEMPVEIPLPPSYSFHSIFVCPVSKEQATDSNPPMMLPCGHVLCQESLKNASKGARFKCPYCPVESDPKDAKKVFL